ncbi:hypothetical protein PCASD_06722 [Puccinia coronata f. sp. avenae]|uniref:Uncharacterized protein n=1 Tax=Puccinia coronata f. sp. avenae TaxID=200324 RepID=A0A2N5TF28_9BASI|nr:hypothetical protein PCASD_06722 [Puccinia coronata f. sp. avenae]
MPLTAYHLLCLFAILAVTQAQLKPSSILCARSHNRSPFMAEHCRNALREFTTESGVTITKPSLSNSVHHTAVLSEALTAVNLGYDKCQGRPTNATIGSYQPV